MNENVKQLSIREYWINKLWGKESNVHDSDASQWETAHLEVQSEQLKYWREVTQKSYLAEYTILFALYVALIKRYFKSPSDFVLGRFDDLTGGLETNVVLATKIPTDSSLKNVVNAVKKEIQEVYAHKDFDISEITESIGDCAFKDYTLWGFSYTVHPLVSIQEVPFELRVSKQKNGNIEIAIHYDQRFASEDLVNHFLTIFKQWIQDLKPNLESPHNRIPILQPGEEEMLLHTFNDTYRTLPSLHSIVALIEDQVAKSPTSVAVKDENTTLTYAELNKRANRLAHYLLEEYKLQQDDLVGVLLPKSIDAVVAILAVLKSGAAYLPIDINYPEERIQYILRDSRVKLLICEDEKRQGNDYETLVPNRVLTSNENNPTVEIRPDSLAYVIYTSGSTGQPKGVMVEHRSNINMSLDQIRLFDVTSNDTIVWFASIAFDASVSEIMMTFYSGAKLLIPSEETIKGSRLFTTFIQKEQATVVTFPPSYIENIPASDLSTLRCIITAGEAARVEKATQLANLVSYFNAYGPTECAVCVSTYQVSKSDESRDSIPIGKPLSNLKVYILDDNLELLPIGLEGKIYVSGIGLARGYINQPELTKQKFLPNPFVPGQLMYETGDIGKWLPDGNICFLGREDEQVKIRGHRIELGEVRNQLLSVDPEISQAVVLAKQHKHESVLVAYLQSNKLIDQSQLRERLAAFLPDYMLPTLFIQLKALPLTSNGKIDKKALSERPITEFLRRSYTAPQNQDEMELATIWQEVLGLNEIGIHENFFELGGHSLVVSQVVNRIYKRLSKTIAVSDFFANPTIAELARKLRVSSFKPIVKTEVADSYPVTTSQYRIWLLSQLEGGSVAYNMPAAIKLSGKIDVVALETSFRKVIARHEALRTYFRLDSDGELRQYILPNNQVQFAISTEDWKSLPDADEKVASFLQQKSKLSFQLNIAPLLRAWIILLKEDEAVFFISIHHIVADGWSIQILTREIIAAYNTLIQGHEIQFPKLDIQYKDYTLWQQSIADTPAYQISEQYWLERFKSNIPVLSLPTFRTRPPIQTFEGDIITFKYSGSLLKQLKHFSDQYEVTLFMTLLASVNTLLAAYSGDKEIVVGTPVSGREHQDLEDQIGLYLNILAIYTTVEQHQRFSDLLQHQKTVLLEAYQHQEYSFDELVSKLELKRDPSRSAIFDVMVALQSQNQVHSLKNQDRFIDLDYHWYPIREKSSHLDLSFTFIEAKELTLEIRFNTNIYDRIWMEKVGGHLEVLFGQFLNNPDLSLNGLVYLTKSERQQVLYDFNKTETAYPVNLTVLDLFEQQVLKNPNHWAISFENRKWSYEELDKASDQLCAYLQTNFELELEDIIAIHLDRSDWLLVAILAVLKAGCAYVPIDTNYPKQRIKFILSDCACKVIIDYTFIEHYKGQSFDSVSIIKKSILSEHLAYLVYTSGSTGQPKGVMIEHGSLVNFCFWYQEYYEVDDCSRGNLYASVAFDASVSEIFPFLTAGATLYPIADNEIRIDPDRLLNFLRENSISHGYLPGVLCQELTAKDVELPQFRIMHGGDVLNLPKSTRLNIHNNYGPTENTVIASVFDLKQPYQTIIPIGKPIANTQLYILSEGLVPVPIGVIGELCISGKQLARGYANRPQLSAKKFIKNPFIEGERLYLTGDLARWLPDGNIEFIGRKDNQVKIRGHRVELGEIENSILKTGLKLKQVVVVAQQHHAEKKLVAYYTTDQSVDKTVIQAYLENHLPEYMIPKYYVELDEIPLTSNGKMDKKALPLVTHQDLMRKDFVAPQSPIEQELASIWQEVLNVENIGVTDNFFELGGHSLSIAKVIKHTQKMMGLSISFRSFYAAPTIKGIIGELKTEQYEPIPVAPILPDYPLTSSQFRFWLLCQMEEVNATYNIPLTLKGTGELKPDLLQLAFQMLIERHESLRTQFIQDGNGDVKQQIVPADSIDFNLSVLDAEEESEELQNIIAKFNKEPFDLAQAPMLAALLIKTQASDLTYLCIKLHHIVGDGHSLQILLRDLGSLYNRLLNDKNPGLTDLNIQFKDYALWAQSKLINERTDHEEFWLNELAGELPILNLPTYQGRPRIQTYNGASYRYAFAPELVDDLTQFATDTQATLFTLLLTGLKGLLHRYTNQDDLIIGIPVSERNHPDLDDQIGLFINTIPIRTKFRQGLNFKELLADLQNALLRCYAHASYPFGELVDKLNLSRDISRSPVFDVLVIHQKEVENSFEVAKTFAGVQSEPIEELGQSVSKFDMTFSFIEYDNRLRLEVEYNTDLYQEGFIKNLVLNLTQFVRMGIQHASQSISQIRYINPEEADILKNRFNQTVLPFDEQKTIVDLIREQVLRTPGNTAIICREASLTYKELEDRSSVLASYLQAIGVTPGTIVGICLGRSIDTIIGLLGVLKSGASYLPLDPFYPIDRLDYIIEHSGAKFILGNNRTRQMLPPQVRVIDLDQAKVWEHGHTTELPALSPNHRAYVIYTSGSTGKPKGVQVTHRNLTNFVYALNQKFGIPTRPNNWLAVTSISFDISILELFWTLTRGDKVILNLERPINTAPKPTMDFSLFYFPTKQQETTSEHIYTLLIEGAKFADLNDFEAIWVPERHFHDFGDQFPNPSIAAAAVSTLTSNIRLRSGSVVLPLHDPVRVAEEWSMIDNLSKGRVELSIASGWHPNDFVLASPGDYENRHQVMRDKIATLKKLWQGGTLIRKNGVGENFEFSVHPKPIQPKLPIWITAGGSIQTFEYAGSIGANILTHLLGQSIEDLAIKIKAYRTALANNDFDPDSGKVALMLHTFVAEDAEQVKAIVEKPFKAYLSHSFNLLKPIAEEMGLDPEAHFESILDLGFNRFYNTSSLFGSPESCLEQIERCYNIGVNEIACLIDFGVDEDQVLSNLNHLNRLKELVRRRKVQYDYMLRRMELLDESQAIHALINKHQINHIQSTPSFYEELLMDDNGRQSLEQMDTLLVGGEALKKSLAKRLVELRKRPLHNMYGPTETTIWSAIKTVESPEHITIGFPIANTQIYILDASKQLSPLGVPGELWISGDGVSNGYLHNLELTKSRFVADPFRPGQNMYGTGDLARWLPNGELEFLGRVDRQVKIKGYRIELEEIESVILKLAYVSQCVVAAQKMDDQMTLVGYLKSDSPLEVDKIKNHLRLHLPHYMVPPYMLRVDDFPLTPNGKIDVKRLPSPTSKELPSKNITLPKNHIEEEMVRIWQEFLNQEHISTDDNFFEIGGNSMKAFQLLGIINKALNLNLTILSIFQYPTIGTLADSLLQVKESNDLLDENDLEEVDDLIDFMEQL